MRIGISRSILLIVFFASLTFSSGLRGQSRWHITHAAKIDTSYYSFISVSCYGEICTTVGARWGANSTDSGLFFHSTDGGQTWNSIASQPPGDVIFANVQQIDSLDAIAASSGGSWVIRTFDGWKTWRRDTSIHPADTSQGEIFYNQIYGIDFANPAEGIADEGFGYFISTVDTGKHWISVHFPEVISFHSYGNGIFRLFALPNSIYTTHNNWATTDTSYIVLTDPLSNPDMHIVNCVFGNDDSLAIIGGLTDTFSRKTYDLMLISSDLGLHWSKISLPDNLDIYPSVVTPINQQTIVIAGKDSVGRIIVSTDRGITWTADTVPMDNGMPYYDITSVAVTGSGRIIASIRADSSYLGSSFLAYLEPIPSSVAPNTFTPSNSRLYPNPGTDIINIEDFTNSITIFDPLGRTYSATRNGSKLDVSSLPPGVYFVIDGHSRAKFVKE